MCLAVLGSASLTIASVAFGFARPVASAAGPVAPPPPPPAVSTCSPDTTIFGVLPDARTVTITLLTEGSRGTLRYGARPLETLDSKIVAIAAIDAATVLVLDETGTLHEVGVSGTWNEGLTASDGVVATGWQDDKLAYDGAGHLYGTTRGQLVRYAVSGTSSGYVVGDAEEVGTGFVLETMVALGPDRLLASSTAGEWIVYDISSDSDGRPTWTRRSLGTTPLDPSSTGGATLLPAGAGSFFVRDDAGAMSRVQATKAIYGDSISAAQLSQSASVRAEAVRGATGGPGAVSPSSPASSSTSESGLAPHPAGPSSAAQTIDKRGWIQTLLSVAPSACGSGMQSVSVSVSVSVSGSGSGSGDPAGVDDPPRLVGRTRAVNGFSDGWCTEGAAQLFNAASGHWMDISGDAWQWAQAARTAGWTVTDVPISHSVVVFQPFVSLGGGVASSALGHVAWVDSVAKRGDALWFHIIEMNGPAGRGQWDDRWVKDALSVNPLSGQPDMQFILAP